MNSYISPDPGVGEFVAQVNRESAEQRQRLEGESREKLRQVVLDTTEPEAARGNALLLLFLRDREDPELQELLPDLFEDPKIGHDAIRLCYPTNQKGRERLRTMLDSTDGRKRTEVAIRLATFKDEAVKPYLVRWFGGTDQGERNVAMTALAELDAQHALELFRQSWDTGEHDLEDRLVLAADLLHLGDTRGVHHLETVAQEAKDGWATFAAFALTDHDPVLACDLMLHIIDNGETEAQQSLVNQVWNFERNPNAFNAEGIHEARRWVERQREEHAAGRPTGLPTWALWDLKGR